jgi:putative ABC transport system permease protein
MKVEVEPAGAGLSHWRDRFGKPLVVLMAVVGLLLLIACANIASMLLARGAARQREMAVRVSLGAGRFRLVRQVLTESLLLSAAGSLLGIAVAYWTTGALLRIMAGGRDLERFDVVVQPDARVLLFTAGIALVTGVLFGRLPLCTRSGPLLRLPCGKPGGAARPGSGSSSEKAWWRRRWPCRWSC